jgi:hypothetical protein
MNKQIHFATPIFDHSWSPIAQMQGIEASYRRLVEHWQNLLFQIY